MGHAKLTAVFLQDIFLLGDAGFLVLNLLDVGIGEILIQREDLFLEHLRLSPGWSANCRGRHMWKRCVDAQVLEYARDGRGDTGRIRRSEIRGAHRCRRWIVVYTYFNVKSPSRDILRLDVVDARTA
jgi:hypothetical protein